MNTIRVMFVCLGNICRSPAAHGIMEALVETHNSEVFCFDYMFCSLKMQILLLKSLQVALVASMWANILIVECVQRALKEDIS